MNTPLGICKLVKLPVIAVKVEKEPIVPLSVWAAMLVNVPLSVDAPEVTKLASLTSWLSEPVSRVELSSFIPAKDPYVAVRVPAEIRVP